MGQPNDRDRAHDRTTELKFSEEYQAYYHRQTLAMATKIPNLVGMSMDSHGLPFAAPPASAFSAAGTERG
ncbi:hypothetical protein U1769_16855 [Sphingomonas sp. ZT3P38]|uniref:hypothetical protein n=1 Tax=Parasphingomonas zepuensis TaxID=3096161 RepID=UPI002FC75EF7